MNVDGISSWVQFAITLVVGWAAHALSAAFTAGKKTAEWVTQEHLTKTLEGYARKDQVDDLKGAVNQLRADQNANFGRLFDAILEIKGGDK